MSQNEGWIKLNRCLFKPKFFSKDPSTNNQLYFLYIIIAQKANWDEYGGLSRGQLKTKTSELHKTIFPEIPIKRMNKLINYLIKKGHVKKILISNRDEDEYILEICHYDQFCPKNYKSNWEPSENQVGTVDNCNISISLDNNHAKMNTWEPSENQVGTLFYIEERSKEIKEEENTFSETATRSRADDEEIIKVEPEKKAKKTRKPKSEKAEGKSVKLITAYRDVYRQRYGTDPLINAKVRGQACSLVDRVGIDNCESFIAFYLSHNNPRYLSNAHTLGLALIDAEKLYTEFKMGDYITKRYIDSFEKKSTLRL